MTTRQAQATLTLEARIERLEKATVEVIDVLAEYLDHPAWQDRIRPLQDIAAELDPLTDEEQQELGDVMVLTDHTVPGTSTIQTEELVDVTAELLSLSRGLSSLNGGSDTSLSEQIRDLAGRLLGAVAPHPDPRFDGEFNPRSPAAVEAYARSCEASLAQLALDGPDALDAAVIRKQGDAFALAGS